MDRAALAAALSIVALAASVPAHSQDPVAALGKQSAAASLLEWDLGDASHPVLGPVRFAHTRTAVATPVGRAHVFSSAYVSCERSARTIAIELTNQKAPDDPGGLRPATMPRLVCNSLTPGTEAKKITWPLEARWQVNDLGDALARGLRPSALRACTSIGIVQDVSLPDGWPRRSAPVEFEITPYARALDEIFVTCGELTAYAPAAPAAARRAVAAAPVDPGWRAARTVAGGRTNLRAKPNVRSSVVARLPPDVGVLAQPVGDDWWRVKSRNGAKFEGYVREDRLIVK